MRKVESIKEIAALAKRGESVRTSSIEYFKTGAKASAVMGFSGKLILKAIEGGLWWDDGKDIEIERAVVDGVTVLEMVQDAAKKMGLGHKELGKMTGVTRSGVGTFLGSKSCTTERLDKFIGALGLSFSLKGK